MHFRGQPVRPQPAAIFVISVYEASAIATGKHPTITDLVLRLPRAARAMIVGLVASWFTFHFRLVERALE